MRRAFVSRTTATTRKPLSSDFHEIADGARSLQALITSQDSTSVRAWIAATNAASTRQCMLWLRRYRGRGHLRRRCFGPHRSKAWLKLEERRTHAGDVDHRKLIVGNRKRCDARKGAGGGRRGVEIIS